MLPPGHNPTERPLEFELPPSAPPRKRYTLRLSAAALRERFQARNLRPSVQKARNQRWFLCIACVLLIVTDRMALHAHLGLIAAARLVIFLPLLFAAAPVHNEDSALAARETALHEAFFATGAVLMAAITFALYRGTPPSAFPVAVLTTLSTLIAANILLRLRFRFAAITTAAVVAIYIASLLLDPALTHAGRLANAGSMLWGTLLVLFANHSLERQDRFNFLLSVRNQQQTETLAAQNVELTQRSKLDSLTGLANRAFLDHQLHVLWNEAVRTAQPLSVVLIDIDHFKVVNDTQGHLFGDEVLKRVAILLRQALRGKHDFAARYGGEEFILLLPETTLETACNVAERIRAIVQIAGSPAPAETGGHHGIYTTVSCGVSCAVPSPATTARKLIHSADKALYAAKAAGRNRVRTAQDSSGHRIAIAHT